MQFRINDAVFDVDMTKDIGKHTYITHAFPIDEYAVLEVGHVPSMLNTRNRRLRFEVLYYRAGIRCSEGAFYYDSRLADKAVIDITDDVLTAINKHRDEYTQTTADLLVPLTSLWRTNKAANSAFIDATKSIAREVTEIASIFPIEFGDEILRKRLLRPSHETSFKLSIIRLKGKIEVNFISYEEEESEYTVTLDDDLYIYVTFLALLKSYDKIEPMQDVFNFLIGDDGPMMTKIMGLILLYWRFAIEDERSN